MSMLTKAAYDFAPPQLRNLTDEELEDHGEKFWDELDDIEFWDELDDIGLQNIDNMLEK